MAFRFCSSHSILTPFCRYKPPAAHFQSSNGSFNHRSHTSNAQKPSWRSSAPSTITTTNAAGMGIKERGGTGDCGGTTPIICNSTISKRKYLPNYDLTSTTLTHTREPAPDEHGGTRSPITFT